MSCTVSPRLTPAQVPEDWTAYPASVETIEGSSHGPRWAVLFSTSPDVDEEAGVLLENHVFLTGLGFGPEFGAAPLSADELAESPLEVLTSPDSVVDVTGFSPWDEGTCDDGMDTTSSAMVGCLATSADGRTRRLHVIPATYSAADHGLLVGIDNRGDG